MVLAWSGLISNIPDGWSLCDGTAYDESTCSGNQKVFKLVESEIPSGEGSFGEANTNYAKQSGWLYGDGQQGSIRTFGSGTTLGTVMVGNTSHKNAYHGPYDKKYLIQYSLLKKFLFLVLLFLKNFYHYLGILMVN